MHYLHAGAAQPTKEVTMCPCHSANGHETQDVSVLLTVTFSLK